MRMRALPVALLVLGLGGVGAATTSVASPAGPTPAPAPATHSIVVRPVTSDGHTAPHFKAKTEKGDTVDCSGPAPSPGSVDPNIEECSPSAAYAIACWKAAKAHHTLCTRDPSRHKLVMLKYTGTFGTSDAASAASNAPLIIILTDGTKCSIRDGGAWGTLQQHPTWTGSYSCDQHGVVWAPLYSHHYGINESSSSWTVHTGSAAGTGNVKVRHIKKAYFVGTAS